MMDIHQEVEHVLGRVISAGNDYKSIFTTEDRDGRMDQRTIIELLALILTYLDMEQHGQKRI